jgi:hypothetical protein
VVVKFDLIICQSFSPTTVNQTFKLQSYYHQVIVLPTALLPQALVSQSLLLMLLNCLSYFEIRLARHFSIRFRNFDAAKQFSSVPLSPAQKSEFDMVGALKTVKYSTIVRLGIE